MTFFFLSFFQMEIAWREERGEKNTEINWRKSVFSFVCLCLCVWVGFWGTFVSFFWKDPYITIRGLEKACVPPFERLCGME